MRFNSRLRGSFFTRNVNASKISFPVCAILTTLCSQPFRRRFIESKVSEDSHTRLADKREPPVRIVLPYKDQKSANVVRKQLADLSRKINVDISPVYTSRKIKDEIKVREDKPPLVSQQCVVYSFQCGLCDAGYVGYTCHTYTNELRNTKDQQSETTSESSTIWSQKTSHRDFES